MDKEDGPARHQTGHNSGVIHAGIYYAPGSLKAKLCREGLDATKAFCATRGIEVDSCGKLIVATNDVEVARLDALHERAAANGLSLEIVEGSDLAALEPRIRGRKALLSRDTAIVDYRLICDHLAAEARAAGASMVFGAEVNRIVEGATAVEIGTDGQTWSARQLVVCGGLQADRLARAAGLAIDFRIVPFRGEYFRLPDRMSDVVRHLIYPAPDPSLPFLGIHLTRMIDGSVTVGPNAVLGLSREGYAKFSANAADLWDMATFPGLWRLLARNWRHAAHELRGSLLKSVYLEACRKYCPELELDDLQPYRAGIRAQAVTLRGEALHDFVFRQTPRMLHVCNAPSPAATSAFPIARMIVEKLAAGAG